MDSPEQRKERKGTGSVGRMGRVALVVEFCVGIYVLSIRPVVRLTQYKNQAGRYKLPGAVLVLYYPLFAVTDVAPSLGNLLDEYLKLWVPAELGG